MDIYSYIHGCYKLKLAFELARRTMIWKRLCSYIQAEEQLEL